MDDGREFLTPERRRDLLETAASLIITAVGDQPGREGLRGTPRRFAEHWLAFADYDAGRVSTAFESAATDQMIVVGGMRVWSVCEHHLLPFWCDVTVGYIARGRVLGLSKFGRIAKMHAHRLQMQERLVEGIADDVMTFAGTPDVAVLARGEHLCMTMRGVQMPGTVMTSSSIHGAFLTPEVRAEFMALALPR